MTSKKEFKTLKDIGTLYLAPKEELKAEAIKRWKYYEKLCSLTINPNELDRLYGKMEEIEEFNNLTKEDLK